MMPGLEMQKVGNHCLRSCRHLAAPPRPVCQVTILNFDHFKCLKTSNYIIEGNGMILGLQEFFVVVLNYYVSKIFVMHHKVHISKIIKHKARPSSIKNLKLGIGKLAY